MKFKFFPWLIGFILLSVILLASFPAPSVVQTDSTEKQSKVTFNAPFTLHFSHIMNQRSVEDAFMIVPKIEGDFAWKDFRTLEFVPKESLKIGDAYRIVIKGEAKSIWMKKMTYDATLDFLVTGPPFVFFADPPEGGVLIKDEVITVMFDRPMNWEGVDKDELIQINPSVSGTVDFLGKSAFQYTPQGLSPSQRYEAVIPAGLSAIDGGKMEEAFTWVINTPNLKAEESDPTQGTTEVPLNQVIQIQFDGPTPLEGIKPGVNALLYPSNDLDAGQAKKMDGFFNTEVTYATGEDGEPLKNILLFAPTFEYQPGEHYRFVLKSDKDLHLEADFELEFDTITSAKNPAEALDPEMPEAKEPSEEAFDTAKWQNRSIQFFVRGENPRLLLNEGLSQSTILSVCQVSSNEFIRQSARHGWNDFSCETESVTLNPVQKNSAEIINLAEYFDIDWVTGIYFVSIVQGEKKEVYHFMVEDTSLMMKRSDSDLLIWALDPKTGAPLAGMDLEILDYDGEEVGHGRTDENGLYSVQKAFDEGIYVRGKLEKDDLSRWGLVSDRWLISDDSSTPLSRENSLFVILNQRVYKPGDRLQFQGIWRNLESHVLSLPSATQVTVNVEDSNQNFLSSKRVPMRRNGSFDGSLDLPDNSSPGYYWVTISDLNHLRLSPPIPIRITDGQEALQLEWLEADEHYSAHSTPVFIAKARFQNGLPAPKVEGHYELFRRPVSSIYQDGAIRYRFNDMASECLLNCQERSLVTARDFVFDLNGEIKLLLTEDEEAFLSDGYLYDLQLSTQIPGQESVSLFHSFELHQGSFDLGMGLKHAVIDSSNKAIEASVLTLEHGGAFTEGKKIRLSLIDRQGVGKTVYETSLSSELKPTAVSISVNSDMEDGVYLLRAESMDEKRNILRAELPVFLSTNPSVAISQELLLAVDQSQYFVGGRAWLLLNAPGATEEHPVLALMTYERDGLLGQEFLELTQAVSSVFIPIDEAMAPGFLATVSRFDRGVPPTFSSSSQKIDVGNDESRILIDSSFEPAYPKPGEELTVKITTSDYQNRPLASVLTLNVLDSLSEPEPLDYSRFFPSLPTALRAALNFGLIHPSTLLPASAFLSLPANAPLNPAKSVYFNPLISTNNSGQAEITFRLPEKKGDLYFTVSATKDAHLFGSEVFSLQMNNQLLIQPILPTFVLPGDQTVFGAAVKNISNQMIQSRLEFISDAVTVKGDKNRNFSLDPGQQTELFFNVVVNNDLSVEEISLQFQSGQDSVSHTIPLRHLKTFTGLPNSGLIGDIWSSRVQLPKEAYSHLGELVLSMSGGTLGFARVQADILEDKSPVSNYWLAARLLSRLSFLSDQPPLEELDSLQSLVATLLKMADSNGAYRFWNESSSSPFLTALVLLAYQRASLHDLHVDSLQINRTINHLWESFESASLKPDEATFILWVLGESAQYDTERALNLFKERESLSISGQAFLLLNLNQLVQAGQSSMISPYNSLKAEMADKAIEGENLVYFDNNSKTTAVVLFALSELDSDNPLLEPMANHVILQDNDLINEFNPETALWTILSLKSYVDHSHPPEANYIAQAKLNGSLVLDQSVTSGSLNEVFQTSVPVGGPLLSSEKLNDLLVKKNGVGPLYLDAHLISFLEPARVTSAEEGLLIVRNLYEVDEEGQKLAVSSFRKGKNYLSELLVIVPKDADYVTISEEFPAGTQISYHLNKAPLPFTLIYQAVGQAHYFAPHVPAGVYKIEIPFQALVPGTYHYLPATIQSMLQPEVMARTAGGVINVVD